MVPFSYIKIFFSFGAGTGFLLSGLKTYNYETYSFNLRCFLFYLCVFSLVILLFVPFCLCCIFKGSFILAFSFSVCLFYM